MPITDPFPIVAAGDDQHVSKNATTYPPGGSVIRSSAGSSILVGREKAGFDYFIYNGLLKFDTSALPDANSVSGATLRIHVTGRQSADALSVVAGWYAWNGTDSDYSATPETSAHAGTLVSSFVQGAQNDIVLVGAAANVSKTGLTYLRLHLTQRAADAAPSSTNELAFAALDEPTTLPEPILLVTHTPPGTVSTLMVGGVGI